jgi:hypothetical protein
LIDIPPPTTLLPLNHPESQNDILRLGLTLTSMLIIGILFNPRSLLLNVKTEADIGDRLGLNFLIAFSKFC